MKLSLLASGEQRRNRIGIALLVLCGLLLFWLVRDHKVVAQIARATGREASAGERSDALLLAAAANPASLPELVRSRYRIGPDRRLRIALAQLQQLATGERRAAVEMRFRDRGWDVLVGSAQAGRLSEVPSFAEGTALLVGWAKAHASFRPTTAIRDPAPDLQQLAAAIDALDPQGILTALHALDAAFVADRRHPAIVEAASRGFAWLSLFSVDRPEQADALFGRAWALLALESSLGLPSVAEHETLIASSLGYEAAAAAAARGLAEGSPLRLYAAKDLAGLARACAALPQDLVCRYLELALLAERNDDTAFERAAQRPPFDDHRPLPVLGLISGRGGPYGSMGNVLAAEALAAAAEAHGEAGKRPPPAVEGASRRIEEDAQAVASKLGGELLDRDSVASFYRAAYYSGILDEASFALDHLGSAPAARQLVAAIEDPAPGTATQLVRWIEVRAGGLDNTATVAGLQSAIRDFDRLSGSAGADVAEELYRLTSVIDVARRAPLPALYARLDSRPLHLTIGAALARRGLTSPYLYEKYLRAAAQAAPHLEGSSPATVALMDEDAPRLRAIVDDPAMSLYSKEVALHGLEKLGHDKSYVRAGYAAISHDADTGWNPLFDYLEKSGDFAGALAAVRGSIAGYTAGQDLGWAHLVTGEARMLRKLGRLDEALAAITPAVPSWKNEVLLEAARIELERGNVEAGLTHARNAVERYPDDSEASALVARARWMSKSYREAAEELAASKNRVTGDWNRYLVEAFTDAFAKAPEEDASRALDHLASAKIAPHVLAQLAGEWGRRGHADAALRIIGTLRDPEPQWQTQILFVGYDLLRETAGDAAALAWVEKDTGARSQQEAILLLQMRRCALLLARFPPPLTDGQRPLRSMVAACLLQAGETSGPRWDSLVEAVQRDRGTDDFFRNLTLLILGKGELPAVAKGITDLGGVESIAWAMGLRAAHEGRAEEAEAWFQTALEAATTNQPPHAWAWAILSDWLQSGRSLAVLQRRGGLAKPPVHEPAEKAVLGSGS